MKFPLIIIIVLINSIQVQAKKFNVLFLGNSYVAYNDLPNTFKSICTSMGDSVTVDTYNPGGFSFAAHSTDATTISKIQQGNWDYVILQGQSQEPSFSPSQVQTQTYPFAKKLDSMVKAYNACAEVVFYMTWGRKYGDASNCANYPPVCTYIGMQQRLRESYGEMAMINNSTVCPAGIVWKKVRETDSTLELYNPDLSHPSVAGTYLVACSFYASMFHKQFSNATFISAGVTAAQATIIQNATSKIILDSMETWQQFGKIPNANFVITNTTNPIAITNNSTRQTISKWVFGDGVNNTNNASNFTHTYANNGAYTIILTAENACAKTDTASQTVGINVNLASNDLLVNNCNIHVQSNQILLQNLSNISTVNLYNMDGKLLVHQKINGANCIINTTNFLHGIIVYQLLNNNNVVVSNGKISL
jgi:PKD repeat protein